MVKWLNDAIFYEIYPQSFQDTNADGIGDFEGIIQRLDYIRSIGCNAIWMNPCFDSPFNDAGYDVRDYYTAAPRYGTNDDLRRLFAEVHKRGMHILLDLVPGHTSVEHKWFTESMKPERNEFSDRYIWTDTIWDSPEGMGCLRGISARSGSAALNFFSSQPALNYGWATRNPDKPYQMPPDAPAPMATRQAIKDIMRFWLTMGCDGFRVDMAGSLVKNDPEYRETIKVWQDISGFMKKEFPEAAMVSEWGDPNYSIQAGFDMDFLLHFGPPAYTTLFRSESPYFSAKGEGNLKIFLESYSQYLKSAGDNGLVCIPSGNHDMPRLARGRTTDELKCCYAFLLTVPGAPFIYYGDEIGMNYLENLTSVEGGYDRTGSRSPMQWDKSVNAGFSTAAPDKMYIRLDDAENRPTVEASEADTDSLLNFIRKLTALRSAHKALGAAGKIEFLRGENEYPLVYTRNSDNEKILIAINPTAKAQSASLGENIASGLKELFSFGSYAVENYELSLSPFSVFIASL